MIENLEKVINENKYNMLFLIILYNMKCHENYSQLKEEEKENLLKFIHELYLKDENKIDLAVFSDTVMNNYKEILKKEVTRNDIYNLL